MINLTSYSFKETFPIVHFFRVVAAAGILATHINMVGIAFHREFYNTNLAYFKNFWIMTEIFLLLSGFLLSYPMFLSAQTGGDTNSWLFIRRRLIRIFPLYIFALLITIIAFQFSGSSTSVDWRELVLLTNFPFSTNYFFPWSWNLSLILQLNLITPFAVFYLSKLRSKKGIISVCLILWVLMLPIKLFFQSTIPYEIDSPNTVLLIKSYASPFLRLDTYLLGLLMAFLVAQCRDSFFKLLNRPMVKAILWTYSLTIIYWILQAEDNFPILSREEGFFFSLKVGSLSGLACFITLAYALTIKNRSTFLTNPLFKKLSRYTYGAYLTHYSILTALVISSNQTIQYWPAGAKWGFLFLSTLVLSLLCGFILHIGIERPALSWLDRKKKN